LDVKPPQLIASAVRAPTASAPELGSRSPASLAAPLDRADIRPLDIPAALQILLAEVRASFELTALDMQSETSILGEASILADSPPQTARAVLQVFLQTLPQDTAGVPSWTAALARAETVLQQGLDRGIAAISAWNEVPAMVVDAAKETQALIFSALADDAQNPIWLRPEWAGLAPRLERFRRRRRLTLRQMTDPDYPKGSFDDDNEQRR
jgi:hypothetical protein